MLEQIKKTITFLNFTNIWVAINISILPILGATIFKVNFTFIQIVALFILAWMSYSWPLLLTVLTKNYQPKTEKELFFYSFSSLGNLNKKKHSEILDSVYINFHQPTIDLFIKFIAECKSLNIDLYLVHTPDYLANQNIYTNRDELIQLLDSISKSNNLIFIDYSNHFISANLKYFQDYGHLNEYGRNEFSKILSDSLKNLIK